MGLHEKSGELFNGTKVNSLKKKIIPKNINKQQQAFFVATFITSEHPIYSIKLVYLTGVMLDIFILLNNKSFHTLGI